MSYKQFLAVARELKTGPTEGHWRSATSRAYYAAFHFAGERLENLTASSASPFLWTGRRKDHTGLQEKWGIPSPSNDGILIKNALYAAHNLRKKADYDLHLPFNQGDLEACRTLAAQVIRTARHAIAP